MTPEARAARERKQKIFVVAGGVFLLILLAIQLPKLLGGHGGSETAAPAATSTTQAPVVAPPATTSGTAAPASLPVEVAGARTAKLTSFGLFKAKDPFVQQVVTATDLAAPVSGSTSTTASPAAKEAKKTPQTTTKFTLGPKGAEAPALTVVSVNGQRQALQPGGTFPSADPVFVLVAEHPGTKSVEIGVVGGAYSSGSKTTKLALGKPLTLVNTATGARYRVVLVAAGSGSAAKQSTTPSK